MRGRPGKRSLSSETYGAEAFAQRSAGKRTRTEARYGGEEQRTEGVGDQPFLPTHVASRLEASFGTLPAFDVVVDPAKVPEGARAAADADSIYLRDEGDAHDLPLVAHEVAHVAQLAGGPRASGGGGQHHHHIELEDHSIPAEARENDDETGRGRRSVEEVADRAAEDVEAGRRVAAMTSEPVAEGEMYLQQAPGKVAAKSVSLVLFPGEQQRPDGTTTGHIYVYVSGELKKSYVAAGGPPPGNGYADNGGHTAGVTPDGQYTLAAQEHHTTQNWPMSVVPWGAKLRERADKEIEYSPDGTHWKKATGLDGDVTRASVLFIERTRASEAATQNRAHAGQAGYKPVQPKPITAEERKEINEGSREIFYEGGALMAEWQGNDFGNWSFNMTRAGARSAYYVHTTPDDEKTTAAGGSPNLAQSHGCVHIRPADRAEMMARGYLQGGVKMTVKKYGLQGP